MRGEIDLTQTKRPIKVEELTAQKRKEKALKNPPPELTGDLHTDLALIDKLLHYSSDIIVREFTLSAGDGLGAGLVYADALVDKKVIDQDIMQPLMHLARLSKPHHPLTKGNTFKYVEEHLLTIGEITITSQIDTILAGILYGDTALFIDGSPSAILANTKGWSMRAPSEPNVEAVVRGPREGFTETLIVNLGLIRRRLKDPDLAVEIMEIGQRSKTSISLLYVADIASPELIAKLRRRLENISIDGIVDSGYIEQLIEDSTISPFPQILSTERPDKVVANLLEGRAAILVDGTPFALIAPAVWAQFFHSPEDYYERSHIATFIRLIRLLAMTFSLTLPAIYIAFTSFHPEMLPATLALAIAAARSRVPFSLFLEALIMETMVEILREASVRLPGPIGPTIGIVGGLVLGDAAVRAGIVSPLTVIVVAITAIGSFASPSYSGAISFRILRYPLMFLAATFGFYGIIVGLILIIIHVASLESLGVPYLAPYAPFHLEGQKDAILRLPWRYCWKRPLEVGPQDTERMPKPRGQNRGGGKPDYEER
ncbi:MAG: spore germination protein [Firmicutes bacterium]|nr:spore germination protein [Bacillota bacterium]